MSSVTHVGEPVTRKTLQQALFKQFGNFLHTQATLDHLRDIGPVQIAGLGWVIAGQRGGSKRWKYFLAETEAVAA